jgi:hypothetical protein
MKSITLHLDAKSWPENFGLTHERGKELLEQSKEFLLKIMFDPEKEYECPQLLRDLLSLAQTEEEQNYLIFFTAQKTLQMEYHRDELKTVVHFVEDYRCDKKEAERMSRGLEALLGIGL